VQLCLLAKVYYVYDTDCPTNHGTPTATNDNMHLVYMVGAIFRIPVTTMQRPKEDCGWGFPNIGAKCRTLPYNRIEMLGERERTVISEQMRNWDLNGTLANLPNVTRIPLNLSTYDTTRWIWPTCPLTP